jgi:hypothetical protein
VSRLWRDRLLVSLAPTAVSWVRLSRGLKPRVIGKRTIAVSGESTLEPWQGAVAVLQEEIEQLRRERLAVTVVLSNHFVRYAVVPRSDRSASADEALALGRFHFSKIHGERAAAWDVRLASGGGSKPSVASAVDKTLLDALKATFPPRGRAKLVSVQPYTMSAFNFWRRKIGHEGAWLLLVEPGTACLALIARNEWVTIQNVRSGAASENWPALLDREKHRTSLPEVPTTVLTRSTIHASSALTARKDWHFVVLDAPVSPGMADDEAEAYAMALHAA